jgi:uncharacterized protein YjcR
MTNERARMKKDNDFGKVGRPEVPLPSEAQCETAAALMAIGYSYASLADEFGVSHVTVQRWRNESEIFAAACAKGKAARKKRAMSCMFEQAFPVDDNDKPTRKGDASLMMFWFKTREGWKTTDKVEITASKTDAPTIEFSLKEPQKPTCIEELEARENEKQRAQSSLEFGKLPTK